MKALVEEAEHKLKKIVILYQALVKRRIQMFRSTPSGTDGSSRPVAILDSLIVHLKKIPHQVDELASMFYDLDEDGAKEVLNKCVNEAKTASGEMELSWDGKEDEFTVWFRNWTVAVG